MRIGGVLLDRDGTIIVDKGYVGEVDRVEFIDGAIAAVAALNAAGVPVAVVTNQAGVARGHFGIDDVRAVHSHIDSELERHGAHVDMWLFCPYHPDGVVEGFSRVSYERKPAPGMAFAAAEALDLDLSSSWVVGDRDADVGLACAVGARPIYIGPADDQPGVTSVPDLRAAVEVILASAADGSVSANDVEPKFPALRYESVDVFAQQYASEVSKALAGVDAGAIDRAAKILNDAYDRDATVFVCGNGGSASIANHFQCDHVKGVRTNTDLRTKVVSLSSNVELLTAVANDIGYEAVYEYQLQSQGRPGDVLLVVSSSGRSPNIVRALQWAEANGITTISMTGFEGEPTRSTSSVSIHIGSKNYGVVEDAHQACMHLLAQYVRQSRMSSGAIASTVF